jgi:hypothetical protein
MLSDCSRAQREPSRGSAAPSADALQAARPDSKPSVARPDQTMVALSPGDGGAVLKLDPPSDLGPAGSIAVAARGAVFRTRSDELALVPLDALLLDPHKRVVPADDHDAAAEEALASRAPPPALTRSHAYWVNHGKLVRRPLSWQGDSAKSALEVLAEGALDGTRVAAATVTPGGGSGATRDIAIYIAQAANATDDRRARLWTQGAGAGPFSSDGSGASSVAIAHAGGHTVGISLDARSAMSPVHARTIEVGPGGPARIGADVVVFVGPSPEGHTEIAAAPGQGGPIALVPFARDTTSFGLASLLIGEEPHLDAAVQWNMYPNGIEPAPVAAAAFCGRTWTAYVRPSTATANAESVLVLAPIDRGAFGSEIMAGKGFDFTTVALAPRDDGGAWLAWVGNGRSWVRGIRC